MTVITHAYSCIFMSLKLASGKLMHWLKDIFVHKMLNEIRMKVDIRACNVNCYHNFEHMTYFSSYVERMS